MYPEGNEKEYTPHNPHPEKNNRQDFPHAEDDAIIEPDSSTGLNNSSPEDSLEPKTKPAMDFHINSKQVQPSQTVEVPNSAASEVPSATSTLTPTKKPKTISIIVTAVIALVLVGAAIAALLFFNHYNSPQNTLVQAVTGSVQAKNLTVAGKIIINAKESQNTEIKSITITLDGQSSIVPTSSRSTISLILQDDNEIKLGLDSVYMKNAELYFKISGLQDAIWAAELPDDAQVMFNFFEGLIQKIDNSWYKLALTELDLDTTQSEALTCTTRQLDRIADSAVARNEIAGIYREYSFLDIIDNEKTKIDGFKPYDVKIDRTLIKNFLEKTKNSEALRSLLACSETLDMDLEQYEPTEDEEIETSLTVLVGGNLFNRKIQGLIATIEMDEFVMTGDLRFEYPEALNIEAPDDAKSLDELVKEIEEIFEVNI